MAAFCQKKNDLFSDLYGACESLGRNWQTKSKQNISSRNRKRSESLKLKYGREQKIARSVLKLCCVIGVIALCPVWRLDLWQAPDLRGKVG